MTSLLLPALFGALIGTESLTFFLLIFVCRGSKTLLLSLSLICQTITFLHYPQSWSVFDNLHTVTQHTKEQNKIKLIFFFKEKQKMNQMKKKECCNDIRRGRTTIRRGTILSLIIPCDDSHNLNE